MFGILVFGDNIAHGRGELPSTGWVGRLKNHFESLDFYNGLYNLSFPGETSQSLVKRMKQETCPRVWKRKDDDRYIILIAVGLNDVKCIINDKNHVTKPEAFVENLLLLQKTAREFTDDVYFVGITSVEESKTLQYQNNNGFYSNETITRYNSLVADTVDRFIPISLSGNVWSDGLHLNSAGYEQMSKQIIAALEKHFK